MIKIAPQKDALYIIYSSKLQTLHTIIMKNTYSLLPILMRLSF